MSIWCDERDEARCKIRKRYAWHDVGEMGGMNKALNGIVQRSRIYSTYSTVPSAGALAGFRSSAPPSIKVCVHDFVVGYW